MYFTELKKFFLVLTIDLYSLPRTRAFIGIPALENSPLSYSSAFLHQNNKHMRKIFLFASIGLLAACNNGAKQDVSSMAPPTKDTAAAASTENLSYAYTAGYSSKFEIGDPKNAQLIMALWKDWEDGDLSKSKDKFADTVTLYFSGGDMMRGSRDSVIAMSQKFRDGIASVKNRVDAFTPLKSVDKNESWVAVWGMETDTDKKGKVDSTSVHEVWRINKDGKADLLYQFAARTSPPTKKK
jgi:hypothetical protein